MHFTRVVFQVVDPDRGRSRRNPRRCRDEPSPVMPQRGTAEDENRHSHSTPNRHPEGTRPCAQGEGLLVVLGAIILEDLPLSGGAGNGEPKGAKHTEVTQE